MMSKKETKKEQTLYLLTENGGNKFDETMYREGEIPFISITASNMTNEKCLLNS
ncbi:hypothetical protein GCM10008968_23500 [Bacillus horti]